MKPLSIIGALLLFAACPGPGPGAGSAGTSSTNSSGSTGSASTAKTDGCPQEPGGDAKDTPPNAPVLPADGFTGCLGGADNRDVFQLPKGEPGGVTYYVITVASEQPVELTTYDRVHRVSAGVKSADGKFWVQALNGEPAWIGITGGDKAVPYKVTVRSKRRAAKEELNDVPSAAKPLTVGAERVAFLSPAANKPQDTDIFSFELAKPSRIKIELYPGIPELVWNVRILKPDGNYLVENRSQQGRELIHSPSTELAAGKYLIEIKAKDPLPHLGAGSPPEFIRDPYRLTVSTN